MNWYKKAQQKYLWNDDPELPNVNTPWQPSGSLEDDIGDSQNIEELMRVLDAYKVSDSLEEVDFPNKEKIWTIYFNNVLYVIDISFPYPSIKKADEWIYDIPDYQLFTYVDYKDFNEEFWGGVYPGQKLYHGSPEENIQDILKNGLIVGNKTRGIGNRSTGDAIFASYSSDTIEAYGHIIEINVGDMKKDGYMILVGKEEPIEEAEMRKIIADKIGMKDFYQDTEAGIDDETVIFYDNIPPKYLKAI